MSNADELVRRYIMRQYRGNFPDTSVGWPQNQDHLATCSDATVVESEAYGCRFWDTRVTGVQFTAVIACPHGERHEFEFGELGELSDILADMERDEDAGMPEESP